MKVRRVLIAAVLACVPLAASAAVVQYAAPAGTLPTEHLRNAVFDAILPSGRVVTPAGASVVTGMNALGMTLTPDGRFAIVSNDDERQALTHSAVDAQITGGYSIAVVDTASMHVVDRFVEPGETYFAGLAAIPDPRFPARTLIFAAGGASNRVYVMDLDTSGNITPDVRHVITVPGPLDAAFGDFGHSFPATLVASPDARRIYLVDEGGDAVTAIDPATRALSGTTQGVGFFPFGAALAGNRLLVSNEGLMRYAKVDVPTAVPPFRTPPADLERASSLSLLAIDTNGDLVPAPGPAQAVPMDPAPDGFRTVGGAHPTAISVSPDAAYAYVAMTNVDRIATVRLGETPQVVGGTELRLFNRGPYGTQPTAMVLSKDGTRLYVTLSGLNAIAVLDARDPTHLHRLGLIPTGWFPTALALSADDRTLYVTNTKGFGHDVGFTGDAAIAADSNAVWSTLQKIDLGSIHLSESTYATLKNTRTVAGASTSSYPKPIRNVVVILEENKTFDAMLGDLGYGPADPQYVMFGEAVTPNLHALARRFALAGNLFADAEESDAGHQFFTSGLTTAYAERTLDVKNGRSPLANTSQDPEDYPRTGSIFNNLARHHMSFRDYGDLMRVSGYAEDGAQDPTIAGLGGRYTQDVPAPAVLAGHVDLNYPSWNVRVRGERRAHEFVRDYAALVRAHHQPRYTYVWLPAAPSAVDAVADGDRALGTIVAYLTHLPSWKNTAIFVMPDDAQGARDHVDEYRTYALVISPYAKRHYVGMRHLSTASVLKTSEELLGLPALSLGDLLATDMSDFFSPQADVRPYICLP